MDNIDNDRVSPLSWFVGRENELLRLEAAFDSGVRVAVIRGPPGSGKTALVQSFLRRSKKFADTPCLIHDVFSPQTVLYALNQVIRPKTGAEKLHLSVIDEVKKFDTSDLREIDSWLDRYPNEYVIFTTRLVAPIIKANILDIELGPLAAADFEAMIRSRLGIKPDARMQEVFRRLDGNPRLVISALNALSHGNRSWEDLLKYVNSFECPGLVGLDGRPLTPSSTAFQAIALDVRHVNSDVLRRVQTNPEEMRHLTSRQFEELIADLLTRLGYSVDLTQQTRDGGFDIYAAKKEPLGSFLYLVECKRYTPPNKVGVDVVRSLYGVVQSENANAGIVASSSFFTGDAQEFQRKHIHELQLKDFIAVQEWLNQARP